MHKETIFLGLLGARGDCVFGTTLAHQIKKDYPDSHLIWAISESCKDILRNNPHVDEVWTASVDSHLGSSKAWGNMMNEVIPMISRGAFNHVYLPQINPANYHNYDGTIRPSLYRAYGNAMTVPIRSIMIYSDCEKKNVAEFLARHKVENYQYRILFECSGGSGQTFVDFKYTLAVAQKVAEALPDACLILSSPDSNAPIFQNLHEPFLLFFSLVHHLFWKHAPSTERKPAFVRAVLPAWVRCGNLGSPHSAYDSALKRRPFIP